MKPRSYMITNSTKFNAATRLPGFDIRRSVVPVTLIVLALVTGLAIGFVHRDPLVNVTFIGFFLLLPLIWSRPVLAVYVMVAGATIFETFVLGFPDSTTDRMLFFRSFKSAGAFSFLIFTPAEAIMGVSLVIIILKRMAQGLSPLKFGPLALVIGFYMAMVCFGVVWGLGKGGDINLAIWESRAQFYLLIMYLVAVNTLEHKSQVARIIWIIILAASFKGFLGIYRLVVTMGGDLDQVTELAGLGNSLLAHEESYFFVLAFLFVLTFFMFKTGKDQMWATLFLMPPMLVAFLANQRRLGPLLLGVGVLLVIVMTYRLVPSRRKAIMKIILIGAIALPPYIGATWNMTGLIAEPTSALKSVIQPSKRDADSNDYRVIETENVTINVQINPLMGRGYGHTMIQYIPLEYIGDDFPFWDVIPHNTLLWVWMRLGIVGFSAFWFMVGRSLIAAVLLAKKTQDRYTQSVSVLAMVAIVTWVIFGGLDMGLVNFRMVTLVGVMLGVIGFLTEAVEQEPEPVTDEPKPDKETSPKYTTEFITRVGKDRDGRDSGTSKRRRLWVSAGLSR